MIMAPIILAHQQGGGAPPGGLAPVAFFSGQLNAPMGSTIMFSDHSLHNPTSWSWAINGNQFSIAQNPSYYFPNPGQFDIALTATNSFGSNTEHQTMNVFNPNP